MIRLRLSEWDGTKETTDVLNLGRPVPGVLVELVDVADPETAKREAKRIIREVYPEVAPDNACIDACLYFTKNAIDAIPRPDGIVPIVSFVTKVLEIEYTAGAAG